MQLGIVTGGRGPERAGARALLGADIASEYGYPAAFGAAAIISGIQLFAMPLLKEIRTAKS